MGFRFERWTLEHASLPQILRYCPHCKDTMPFACSERFRVNAQKKVLDVWLLYRCVDCDLTWKLPILERCAVSSIDPRLQECFEANDAETAQRFARDTRTINGHAIRSDPSDLRVTRTIEPQVDLRGDTIRLEIIGACDIRLDRLLARELAVPRSALLRNCAEQRILLSMQHADALTRRAQHGLQICVLDGFEGLRRLGSNTDNGHPSNGGKV